MPRLLRFKTVLFLHIFRPRFVRLGAAKAQLFGLDVLGRNLAIEQRLRDLLGSSNIFTKGYVSRWRVIVIPDGEYCDFGICRCGVLSRDYNGFVLSIDLDILGQRRHRN